MIRFAYHDHEAPATTLDAWQSMPEATLPRWSTMSELVSTVAGDFSGRVAFLGYPNPRAAVRVLAGSPQTRGAALVSPVPGFSERADALARRARLSTAVIALRGDPRASRLRARFFDLVLGRIPVDDVFGAKRAETVIADHLVEMLRIGTPRALLLLHITVRTDQLEAADRATTLAAWVAELLHCAGVKHASLGSSVTRRQTGTVDIIGWAQAAPRS